LFSAPFRFFSLLGGAQRLYADTPSGGRPLFVIRFPAIKMADFVYTLTTVFKSLKEAKSED